MGAAHLCDPSFGWEVIKAAVSLSSTGFTPRGDPCGFVPLMHFCPDLMIFPPSPPLYKSIPSRLCSDNRSPYGGLSAPRALWKEHKLIPWKSKLLALI